MRSILIELEDNGQDFLQILCDDNGIVIETRPFQTDIWKGASIPIHDKDMFAIGEELPINHPPNIIFGFLKHKIIKITEND